MIDYSAYTNISSVPAGAILDRIIRQQKRTKVDVASSAHMIPQRLNDLIKGTRRFTPKNSMDLEHSLNIGIAGFFYMIQAKHDIYEEQKKVNMLSTPDLSKLTKTTFWDVDINKIDWTKCATWAISRVLEYGNSDEIKEIKKFYGIKKVNEIYSNPKNFRLYDKVQVRLKSVSNETS
ncbi:MAG: XRE family transcriptional regulator [Paludibacteraceae bacterium]|nr:XRE family transcriptional regulator [Paludibacteraceae bacterium]